ncbi:MAG TPA: carbohydrate-binding family 9-like protein [Bacteroidota bacterium]
MIDKPKEPMHHRRTHNIIALILGLSVPSIAQGTLPKTYICYKTQERITIDGTLNELSWQKAPWTDFFLDIEGMKKSPPRFRTRAKMLWDDSCFYVGAELQETDVWGTIVERDAVIFHDNDFEVFIDPNGDNHEYYEFEINARNTVWDLFLPKPYKDGGHAVDAWNCEGLKSAVKVYGTINHPGDVDTGWSVEIAMPWKALARYAHKACPPGEDDQWRVNFSRVEWKTRMIGGQYQKIPNVREDNWVWSPQGLIDMHWPEHWGYVQFTSSQFGQAKFKPDSSLRARMVLMNIYYAERKYFAVHNQWAGGVDELKADISPEQLDGTIVTISLTADGYVASAECLNSGRTKTLLHIRQDSLIW